MDMLKQFDPTETVCFTGHRPKRLPQEPGLSRMRTRLSDAIEDAVGRGKISFVSGAMSGFDVEAAEALIRLKAIYPQIQCILLAPFAVRFFDSGNWTPEWKARLLIITKQADFAMFLSEHSYKGVCFARNRAIMDMASEVIAYYDGGSGGTKYTIDYARSKGIPVNNIAELSKERTIE